MQPQVPGRDPGSAEAAGLTQSRNPDRTDPDGLAPIAPIGQSPVRPSPVGPSAAGPPIAAARGVVYGRASVLPSAPGAADEAGPGPPAPTGDGAAPTTAGPGGRSRTLLISVLATLVVLVLAAAVLGL